MGTRRCRVVDAGQTAGGGNPQAMSVIHVDVANGTGRQAVALVEKDEPARGVAHQAGAPRANPQVSRRILGKGSRRVRS
jgi:hypothetical protein